MRWRYPLALFILFFLQLELFDRLRFFDVGPDVLLVLVIASSLVGPPSRGMLTGFVLGLFYDFFLPVPLGLSAFSYTLTAYLTSLTRSYLAWKDGARSLVCGGAGTVFGVTVFVLVGEIFNQAELLSGSYWKVILIMTFYNSALCFPALVLLKKAIFSNERDYSDSFRGNNIFK